MKGMIIAAKLLDSIIAWWIFFNGFYCLWAGLNYEASALIIAGVFWQRAWKAELIKAMQKLQTDARKAQKQRYEEC